MTYYKGATRLAETAAPQMKNRSWSVIAKVSTDGEKTEGVLLGFGGVAAGLTFYVKDGKPIFDYNWFEEHFVVRSDTVVPKGDSVVRLDFNYEGGKEVGKSATAAIFIDDKKVAEGKIEKTVAGRFGIDTFGIGEDTGQPVTFDYSPPFAFTGDLKEVQIELE